MERKLFILLILFLHVETLFSQGLFTTAGNETGSRFQDNNAVLDGYARGLFYGGAKDVRFAALMGELALKSRLPAGKTFLSGEIRVREGIFFDQRRTVLELKEACAGYTGKGLDLYIGNQIVTWGRTDGFNPTNNISPNDYFYLTPEADDQKLANFMVRSQIKFSPEINLDAIAVPVFKPSVYRYDLFSLGEGVRFSDLVLPAPGLKNGALALRLNAEFPGAGFSISWFHGYDPFYGFNLDSFSVYPSKYIGYRPAVYRKDVFGADFAIPVKRWIIRSEMALTFPENPGREMYIPFRDFAWVIAIEREIAGFNTLFQYIGKIVSGFEPLVLPVLADPFNPAAQMAYASEVINYESKLFNRKIFFQQKKSNHALFLSVNKMMAHDLLTLETSGYYNITSEEFLFRSSLKWNIADALTAHAGFSIMQGPGNSVFDEAGRVLNGLFIGLTASF